MKEGMKSGGGREKALTPSWMSIASPERVNEIERVRKKEIKY